MVYYLKRRFSDWNRNFALLASAAFSVGVFYGVQLTLFNNFIVERLGIEAHELGAIESLREVPGFLNVLFIALMIRLALPIVGGVSLIVMGLGIAAYAQVSSVYTLAIYSVIWSLGFHCWLPLEQTMALTFSPEGKKGKWLGELRSATSLGWLITIGICILTFRFMDYEGLYVAAGAATVLGGLVLMFASRKRPEVPDRRFVLKRRYGVFYGLHVLSGWRRQMFTTFAIFALVKVHGMPVQTTMILVLINQVMSTLTSPLMGRLVDRYGERLTLSYSYLGLAFVFAGYAIVQHRPTLYVIYCIDNLLFIGGIALTTYIHKIADKGDLGPTLSMGVTMNHIAAVIGPVTGGLAWHYFGYEIIFFSGSVMAVISLIVSQWVKPEVMQKREQTGMDLSTAPEAAESKS